MTKKQIILTVSSIFLLGAAIGTTIYFVRKSQNNNGPKKDAEKEDEKEVEDIVKDGGIVGNVDESEYSATNLVPSDTVLKIGSVGRKVALLQALLNHYKQQTLKIDGVFGNKTRFALLRNGFIKCGVAYTCDVTDSEFLELAKKTKKDKSFAKKYNPKTNLAMKTVYSKYA